MKPQISLLWHSDIGVIVSCKSGVFYTNQTRGHACDHPQEEGVFFPLPETTIDRPRPFLRKLEDHFLSGWDHLLETDADFIDAELSALGLDFVKVDRLRIKESFEAWVRVIISRGSDLRFSDSILGFEGASGILTWPNSD